MNSIGIIGGADGPTAIFISGSLSPAGAIAAVLAAAAVLLCLGVAWRRHKNKTERKKK